MKHFTCFNFPSAQSSNPWRWCTQSYCTLDMRNIWAKSKLGYFIGTRSSWSSIHLEAANDYVRWASADICHVKKEPQQKRFFSWLHRPVTCWSPLFATVWWKRQVPSSLKLQRLFTRLLSFTLQNTLAWVLASIRNSNLIIFTGFSPLVNQTPNIHLLNTCR